MQIVNYVRWGESIRESWEARAAVPSSIAEEIIATRHVDDEVAQRFIDAYIGVLEATRQLCEQGEKHAKAVDAALVRLVYANSALDKHSGDQSSLYNDYGLWATIVENRFNVVLTQWRRLRPKPITYPLH